MYDFADAENLRCTIYDVRCVANAENLRFTIYDLPRRGGLLTPDLFESRITQIALIFFRVINPC